MLLRRKGDTVARSPFRLRLLAPALLIFVALLSAACTPEHPQSTFDAAGPVAKSQLNLFYVIFWVAVFVFVAVEGIMLYAVIRFRRKARQEMPVQTHGNTPLEIAWTIVPAILLAVIAVPTIITIFNNARVPSPEDALNVKVTAHQWWWEFEYFTKEELDKEEADLERVKSGEISRVEAYRPDPYLVTANELHVPVDVPVSLVLESEDVIHSFWIPKLAGKVDMVPGNTNTMWFLADTADVYLGQCAEFCGISHALMKFRVIADEQPDFDRWVQAQQAPAVAPAIAPAPGTIEEGGRQVFVAQTCWACHTLRDEKDPILSNARATRGPNLTHVGSRMTIVAGIRENTADNLTRWLTDPCKMKPGNIMCKDGPMYQTGSEWKTDIAKRDKDIEALVAYLQSLT